MLPRPILLLVSSVVAVLTATWSPLVRAGDADLAGPLAWLDVGGSLRAGARDDVAVFAELGVAWDAPPRANKARLAVSEEAASTLAPRLALPITPRVARAAVRAAYRAARLTTGDALDGLGSRARWSGLVPEIRVGARRAWDDTARLDLAPSDDWRSSGATHANLWLEARAAFRLDRLLFAGEELGVERLRLEESEAAQRLALRVVSLLAAWQRAWLEGKAAPGGTVSALEASLASSELEASLDVVTGGWFSAWRAREVR
jgi:hypothetical protein